MSQEVYTFDLPGAGPPDVSVHTPSQKFSLHSVILRSSSKWFFTSMSEIWQNEMTAKQASDKPQYHYVLDFDKDGFSTLLPNYQCDSKYVSGKSTTNSQDVGNLCAALHTMFKCFYHQPITVSAVEEFTTLILLADQYDALQPVADSIRASFFEQAPDQLDIQIKNSPTPSLILGYYLRSPRVFKEAFIHVVGLSYEQHDDNLRAWAKDKTIPEPVIRIVSSECRRLERLVASATRDLLVLGSKQERPSKPFLIATMVLKEKLAPCFTRFEAPGHGGKTFREIANCNYEILPYDISMWGGAQNTTMGVSQASIPLVAEIKAIVSHLVKNNLRLGKDMAYLTCAELPDGDLPWPT